MYYLFLNLLINQYQRFIQVQAYFNIQFQMFKNEIVDRNDKYRTDIRSQVHVSLFAPNVHVTVGFFPLNCFLHVTACYIHVYIPYDLVMGARRILA